MAYAHYVDRYLAAGWRCVLPVPAQEKTPPPDGYTGEHGADEVPAEVIERWKATKAHHSIALRLPANIICIDVDTYDKTRVDPSTGEITVIHKRGDDTLCEFTARLGELPPTWASTARGSDTAPGPSRTLFYRVPEGRYATTLGDPRSAGVEILQRHHRYCVVAPSINHSAGDAPYRWYRPDGSLAAESEIPRPTELPELPDQWVAELAAGASTPSAVASSAAEGGLLLSVLMADDRPECSDITNIRLTASEELDAAATGSRHDTATRRVYQLIRAGAFGHTGAGPALAELRDRWEELTGGENRAGEFHSMALSAARKAVTEVAGTGINAPALVDPCLMVQVVPAPSPGHVAPDDSDAPVLTVPAPGPPIVWSRRALIGTEAFDPHGLVDHKLAVSALERIRPVVRYLTDTGTWTLRGAHSWELASKDLADWAITELYELMPDGDPDGSPEAAARAARKAKFGISKQSAGVASKMRAMVQASGHPATCRAIEIDADPEILWAGSLPWDLRRSIERPAMALVSQLPGDTPHLHTAGVAPSGLGVEHPTPAWDAFLAAVWPDAGTRDWVLSVTSVALTGHSDAVLPVLYGESGVGKTSYVSLVMSLLGTYAIAADPRLLVSADNAHASIVFALKGVRLAFIDEAPRKGELATARLKQLTGGGRLTGNPMRGNPVNFDPTHTLVLTSNLEEMPNLQDPALRRRLRLIPCEGNPAEVATARAAITPAVWRAEAPGVLAQLMHHAARWLADRDTAAQYRAPDSIRWRAEDIAEAEDPVRQWIESEMVPDDYGTKTTALLVMYAGWQRQLNPRAPVPSATMFGRHLTRLGYPVIKREDFRYRALRVRGPGEVSRSQPPGQPQPAKNDLPPLVTTEDQLPDQEPEQNASEEKSVGNSAQTRTKTSTPSDGMSADAEGEEIIYSETPVDALFEENLTAMEQHPPTPGDNMDVRDTTQCMLSQSIAGVDVDENLLGKKRDARTISMLTQTEQYGLAGLAGSGGLKTPTRQEDQNVSTSTNTLINDVDGGSGGLLGHIELYRADDLNTHIEVNRESNPPPASFDQNKAPTSMDAPGGYGLAGLDAPDASLMEQSKVLTERLRELRGQRTQLNRLIKKTAHEDPLKGVYTYSVSQLADAIKLAERELREIGKEIKKRAAIAELGGDLLELPARKTRSGPAHSVSTEQAGAIVRAAMAHRANPGRLTVDIESTGYPIGHPDHAVRTVQLGNRDDGVVFAVDDPEQFATCVVLLAAATELEAYSASVEISHLAHIGMIDYQDGWRRIHDVVIKAQLHNPVGTESEDAGLKPQAGVHLADAVTPAAEKARAELFKAAGWTTETKVRSAGSDDAGGWVDLARSGWAQVNTRCRTQVDYAVSDVLDCAALGETLPMPASAVYGRERAVQAAVGAVSYRGIRLDRDHIEAKIETHAPLRRAARRELAALGIDNPGSNDQIAAALLAQGVTTGPNPGQLPIAGRSGKPSVRADVLARLPRTDELAPVIDTVLEFRKHNRILTTYLGPYYLLCTHGDGRMRSTVYTLQADTGRFSCVHENLQNIPTHGGIRECIIVDEGDLFVDADLSGVEVAVLAALSQDPVLMELVASGRKLHKIIAEQVYGPHHTTRQYGYVKNGVFAKIYGAGIWRIANTVGCSEQEAQMMVDALDEFAPGARRWGYELRNRAKAGMDSLTLYSGRVLRLPTATPHKIVNYFVQSTAREILVDGILRWRQTKWGNYGLLVPVHDEQLASVPAADAPEAMMVLTECMAAQLYGVRIKADPKWKQPSDRWLSNDHPMSK